PRRLAGGGAVPVVRGRADARRRHRARRRRAGRGGGARPVRTARLVAGAPRGLIPRPARTAVAGPRLTRVDLVLGMRESDSPWIGSVWTCSTEQVRWMTSVASETWGLIFWEQDGVPHVEVTGPETGTATAPVPAGATFVGVQMAVGTALRMVPTGRLLDGGISLPEVTRRG